MHEKDDLNENKKGKRDLLKLEDKNLLKILGRR